MTPTAVTAPFRRPSPSVPVKAAPLALALPPTSQHAVRSRPPTPSAPSASASPAPTNPQTTPSVLAPPPPPSPVAEKRNFHMFSAEAMKKEEQHGLPSICVGSARPARPVSGPPSSTATPEDPGLPGPTSLKRTFTHDREDLEEKKAKMSNPIVAQDVIEESKEADSKSATSEAAQGNRFLRPTMRPTSLPLKPGTYTPKRLLITPNVLPLISPETPRPKKSYGQLYLNGHAYTYLGLKCSTRPYFCTLNRLQPTYVELSPDHSKLSMYSNWKVYDPEPNPCGLTPSEAIAMYDSRHRPSENTVAGSKNTMKLTHSSYWLSRVKKETDPAQDAGDEAVNAPKRIKIFAGGFESYEEYTYIRGRGRGRYVCGECGIRCKKPSMLKKHIRTHTDVRPFTCRHCSFSFKTKGNLTKHMKSKAHYKKCVEMNIIPVPTVVDDSYIDAASLERQQALRGNRGEEEDAEDSEDIEDEEDDDDEDDDDEDDEEDDYEDADEDIKKRQEREAARSLLSLAQTPHPSPGSDRAKEREAREAGLVAPKGARGLSTYPYRLSPEHPRRITSSIPGTPTLSAISEHKEREKVSHNTGLARDIHEQGVYVEDGTKPLAELNIGDGHQRYYFPSSRDVGGGSAIVSDSIKEESNESETQATGDLANGDDNSSQVKLGASRRMPSLLKPMQLSVAPRTPTTPISEILTPVSEPAFLLASLCSTMEKLPLSLATPRDPHQDSALLQTYLRERAVQDARVKQSQYHPRLFKEGTDALTPVGTPGTPTSSGTPTLSYSNAMSIVDSVRNSACTTTFTSVSQLVSSHISTSCQESAIPRPPPLVWALQKSMKASESDLKLPNSCANTVEALGQSATNANVGGISSLSYLPTLPQSPVSVKLETVLSPVKPLTTLASLHSISSVKLVDATSSRSRENSETDAGADAHHHAIQGVDTGSTQDVKPEALVPSQLSDDKNNTTQSVIAIVSSSGSDTVLSSVKLTDEVALPISTTGSLLSSNSVIVASSGTSSPPPPSTNLIKKPKAEFMPPSSGPAPSYVSVTEDGRSKCTICNKVFSKPSQLHLHVNIHYFERPYRCDACAVSFRTRGHLQKHERSVSHHNKVSMNSTFGTPTTTNPRPYKCDDCKSAFRIHGHLAKHLRSKMHIMKLECVGKLPFGTYAEIERSGVNINEVDTTDCDSSLESLLALAKKLCEKDPTKLNQWKQPETTASDIEESSDEGEPIMFHGIPFPDVVDTGEEDNTPQHEVQNQTSQVPPPQPPQQSAPQPPQHSTQQPSQQSTLQPSQQQSQLQQSSQQQTQPPPQPLPLQPAPSVVSSHQSMKNFVKQDQGAPRNNTTAAAAAAAAVAAAAVAAAASGPGARIFPSSHYPAPGSNGLPSFGSAVTKVDLQSEKVPFAGSSAGLTKDGNTCGINKNNYSFPAPADLKFRSLNGQCIMLSRSSLFPQETDPGVLDRRLGHQEGAHELQEKTDSRSTVCEVPNKTDLVYGEQSLHPPANR